MKKEPDLSTFTWERLDDAALHSTGRIVRACAEIEDMLTLFICNLAKVPEGKGIVLLGRSPYSTKLGIAQYLAKMDGPGTHTLYKTIFESSLQNGFSCRNHLCHGVFLGKNTEGNYGFLTADRLEPEDGAVIQKVHCYSTTYLAEVALALEAFLPAIEKDLRISTLRQRRYGQSLEPLHKGQSQRKSSAKQKRPPRS